jgi:hypothetical protein
MKIHWLAVLVVGMTAAARVQAQQSDFDFSLGLKAWNTEWTSWGYFVDEATNENLGIKETPLKSRLVLIPLLSARYKDFVASASGLTSTSFDYVEGGSISRKEFDANAGWFFAPGVAAYVGYKYQSQFIPGTSFTMGGPTVSVSGTVPIRGGFSMYGTVGLGRLKTKSSSDVQFDRIDYQLSEVGAAYSIGVGNAPKAVSITLGYRMQVLDTKDAFESQNARDLTQGFALGVIATF